MGRALRRQSFGSARIRALDMLSVCRWFAIAPVRFCCLTALCKTLLCSRKSGVEHRNCAADDEQSPVEYILESGSDLKPAISKFRKGKAKPAPLLQQHAVQKNSKLKPTQGKSAEGLHESPKEARQERMRRQSPAHRDERLQKASKSAKGGPLSPQKQMKEVSVHDIDLQVVIDELGARGALHQQLCSFYVLLFCRLSIALSLRI